jgi:uncharacterized membrane protein YvbJ
MVTCTKCGKENEEGAKYCVNCGASLSPERDERREDRRQRRVEDECFGLPNSSAITGLAFGLIIIFWGIGTLFRWEINFFALLVIIFGSLMIAGAIYRLRRSNR